MRDNLTVSDTMVIQLLFLQRALLPDTMRLKNNMWVWPSSKTRIRQLISNPLTDVNNVYDLVMNFLVKRRNPSAINDLHVLHLGSMVNHGHLYCSIRRKVLADVYDDACAVHTISFALQRVLWLAFVDPNINNWMGVDMVPGNNANVTIWFFRTYIRGMKLNVENGCMRYKSSLKKAFIKTLACALRKYPGFTVHFIMQILTSLDVRKHNLVYSRFEVDSQVYNYSRERWDTFYLPLMKAVDPEILDGLSKKERKKWGKLVEKGTYASNINKIATSYPR